MSTFETLLVAQKDHILRVVLHRPEKKNALSPRMVSDLIACLRTANEDSNVRAIVIAGEGKAFCAGGDLGQMSQGDDKPLVGDFADLLLQLVAMEKPVIARVHGHAMGGGLGIVAASTFAVMADEAQMGTPEVNVGLFPMMIMAVLARVMPRRPLLEMMLRGSKLPAQDCLRYGLVNRVVPLSAIDSEIDALTNDLVARSPTAIAHGLRAWCKMGDMALQESVPFLRDQLYALIGTEDAREGLQAFIEKRAPQWTGR